MNMRNIEILSNAQQLIFEAAVKKDRECLEFQDHGDGYNECYEAYNDCHSDYYDAE